MSGRLRTFSLIGTGALAGIAISLGISAYAFRDSRGPIFKFAPAVGARVAALA